MLEEKVGHIQDAEYAVILAAMRQNHLELTRMHRSVVLLSDILNKPEGYYTHIKRTTSSVASAVVFGHRGPIIDNFWARVSSMNQNYQTQLTANIGCL
jgi:hypothetical protein